MSNVGAGGPGEASRVSPPRGIKAVCLVSGMNSAVALFFSAAALMSGGELTLVGLVMTPIWTLVLFTLIGLWTLQFWAWALYVFLQGTTVLGELITGDFAPAIGSLVLLGYVLSKRYLYR